MTDDDEPKRALDVVLLQGPTADGSGVRVVRVKDESLSVGEVRPIEDGKALLGEVVQLKPRDGTPRVCDVEVVHTPKALPAAAARTGPAKVTSAAYRSHWDDLFGAARRSKRDEPSN